jgi:hypothetical protein
MTGLVRLHRDDAGMVGKLIVGWLIAVAIVGVLALDVVSVLFTKFKLADAASALATVAATNYKGTQDARAACQAAVAALQQEDADARFTKEGCVVNPATGEATITLRKPANTLVAERFAFSRHYARVVASATEGPATLSG